MLKNNFAHFLILLIVAVATASWCTAESLASAAQPSNLRPELVLQNAHGHWIRTLAFSPNGQLLASGGYDETIKIWDAQAGDLIRTISGQTFSVEALVFSPDSRTLISGGGSFTFASGSPSHGFEAGEIKFWDVESGELKSSLPELKKVIASLALSADGEKLAGWDGESVRMWDLRSNRLMWSQSVETTEYTGGRSRLAFVSGKSTLAVANGNSIEFWDAQTGQRNKSWQAHEQFVSELMSSSDGKTIASVGGAWAKSWGGQGEILIWDAETGKLKCSMKPPSGLMSGLAFSPDGQSLISGHYTGTVNVWDTTTGQLKYELKGHKHHMMAVAASPNDGTIASGSVDTSIRLWRAPAGISKGVSDSFVLGAQKTVKPMVAFSPNSQTVAVGEDNGRVLIWDIKNGSLIRAVAGSGGTINSVSFSPDGRTLAIAEAKGGVQLLSTENWQPRLRWAAHNSTVRQVVFSPDGRMLATSSGGDNGQDTSVKLWDADTGEVVRTFVGHRLWVFAVAFSPDGKLLASAGGNPWDKASLSLSELRIWNVATGEVVHSLPGHKGTITSLSFAPDGRTLYSSGFDRSVRSWDVENWQQKKQLSWSDEKLDGLGLSKDGRSIITRSGSGIRIVDLETGRPKQTFPKADDVLGGVTLSPDGKTMVSGSYGQGIAHVWSVSLGKEVAWLVDLPSRGPTRNSRLDDKPIEVGSKPIELGSKPIEVGAKDALASEAEEYLVYTPEGYYSGSPAADRYTRFRLRKTLYPAASFQTRYFRPELIKKALAGEKLPAVGTWKGAYPPATSIETPSSGDRVESDTIEVRVQASDDSAIANVLCLINGARVDAKIIRSEDTRIDSSDTTLPSAHKLSRAFTLSVPLPPTTKEVRLQALATDDDGLQSAAHEVLFTRENTFENTRGKLLSLCVGVSRYQDPKLNLLYADRDATELASALSQQGGIYTQSESVTLTNEQATRSKVKSALEELADRATKRDTVILLFSGHGWRSEERKFYFATTDIDTASPARVSQTALPWQEVVGSLAHLSEKSRRVIVLLDACHSGSAATHNELVRSIVAAETGVLVLASSKGDEVSRELPDLQHGIFSKALLEGLSGQAAAPGEKSVTVLDFLSFVARRVRQLSKDRQHAYIPLLENFATDDAIVEIHG